jgi:isoleucyl-tRNA synthetase
LTVDFTEDHRIGKEILSGVSDQYRKLRNTFRYMLGALDGFSDGERVNLGTVPKGTVPDPVPELERYVLHLLADLDAKLRIAVNDFDFNTYVRLLTEFANNDLSAFFFDIRKDCLYCDAATDPKRMAYRTVLDILFHAMVRYAAPVLVFTAEEVWQTRFPDAADSVHFAEWPEVDAGWVQPILNERWLLLREKRTEVTGAIEPMRRDKIVGSSLECAVVTNLPYTDERPDAELIDIAELFIVSEVSVGEGLSITKTTHNKCGRCWRHLPEVTEDGALCGRCDAVLNA